MASYRFELTDYHAVQEANIALDGITVLSGLNGTGKSTVARWLQHTVYTLANYDRLVEKDGEVALQHHAYNLLNLVNSLFIIQKSNEYRRLYDYISNVASTHSLEDLDRAYRDASEIATNAISTYLSKNNTPEDIKRIANYFNVTVSDYKDIIEDNLLREITKVLNKNVSEVKQDIISKQQTRSLKNFFEKIYSIADTSIDDESVHVQLWEDGVKLLNDKEFKLPLMLNRVIYINTQELGNLFNRKNVEGSDEQLLKMLSDSSVPKVNEKSRDLALLIKNLIGGDINVDKQDLIGMGKKTEFRFNAKNGKSFNLKGAATGIISFSYILQLLQNGWLTDKTILIIDEPESHLHPQWIVDYARILVLINKILGTKILLSSHNPDMIAAIQTISESKGLKDVTRFYLAKPSPKDPDRNIYKDLGFNIEEIFDSFNIALERIDSYLSPS